MSLSDGTRRMWRDTAKLADFETFAARMRLDARPAAPHALVDNRLTAEVSLEDQVAGLAATAGWEKR